MTNAKVPMGAPMPPARSLAPGKRRASAGNLLLAAGLAGGFALGLSASLPAMAATEVGVAAAVNPNARGTPPGGGQRTLVLGDNIIHRERIQTQGAGLVQVLLVDGSTFTVGPNSDLVIDEFVYDPNAGQGKLVASFSKGVARFVGGKLSKKPGGVTVNTPVGTIGIRGGIANINMTGNAPTFSLIFGDELTFSGPHGSNQRIYERGYTMEVAGGGTIIRRTRPSDLGRVQQQLVSRPGQSGGARRKPGDNDVNKGVSQNNSGLGYTNTTPPPKPDVVLASRLGDVDAGGNDTNDNNKKTIDPDTSTGTTSFRVLSAGTTYTVAGGGMLYNPGSFGLLGGSTDTDRDVPADIFTGSISSVAAAAASIATAALTVDDISYTVPLGLYDFGASPETGSAFWFVTGRSVEGDPAPWYAGADTFDGRLPSEVFQPEDAVTHAGFLWSGPQQFVFAALFPEVEPVYDIAPPGDLSPGQTSGSMLDASDPIYFLNGQATDFSQYLAQSEEDSHIRTYSLSGDPREMLTQALFGTDPYESELFMVAGTTVDALGDDFVSKVQSSGFLVVESDDISLNNPKFMDVAFLIDGEGASQSSAVTVIAGDIGQLENEAWAITGSRRGGVRAPESSLVAAGGSISTLGNSDGDHLFGPDADNFVLTYDVSNNSPFSDNSPDPYAYPTETFGTFHVGQLESKELKSDYAAYRGTGTLLGYGAGLLESELSFDGMGTVDVEAFASANPGDVVVQFDALNNTVGSEIYVSKVGTSFSEIGYNFAFGQGVTLSESMYDNPEDGGNAYVDNDRYAAVENPNKLANYLFIDPGEGTAVTYVQSDDTTSQNYFFSGNAVPEADAALFSSVENPTLPDKCACAFMHWGYWGARLETDEDTEGSNPVSFGTDGKRRDYYHLATWVAGDLPSAGTIRDVADTSASYSGHAIGNVARTELGQTHQYLASGELAVNWNFAGRSGSLSINNFDGGRFSATTGITDTALSTTAVNSFAGSSTDMTATFTANGSFATDGVDPAAGVLGSFSYVESGGDYTAAGTFMGERLVSPP
ncbi:FecR domain-containing protein [Breoghania sp.]|uniref:FecR family protein n=1 Tax=Breoghania sp. TaxID=2065378 RepID=UPI002AA6B435|nr:FecR domain-containing protein [Breoghania sp.]